MKKNIKKFIKKIKPYILSYIRMDKKIIKFDDIEIKEYEFQQYKSPILINDIDINKKVVPNKFSLVKQDF